MNSENIIIKRSFKLRIFANGASFEDLNIGPILSPFIARDKINLFCNNFNDNTKFFLNEMRLYVIFYLTVDNTFFFIIKGSKLSELFKISLEINNIYNLNFENYLYLKDIFDCAYLKYFFLNNYENFFLNDIFFKLFFFNSISSFKNLYIKNDYL